MMHSRTAETLTWCGFLIYQAAIFSRDLDGGGFPQEIIVRINNDWEDAYDLFSF
jgi:hypothetical protein